ncbi:MAG: hypothetical protein QW578_07845, partial [Thermoplasmatales archaeon]
FSTTSSPSNGLVFGVMFEKSGTFCIGYDPKQVTDYDRQTTSTQLKLQSRLLLNLLTLTPQSYRDN